MANDRNKTGLVSLAKYLTEVKVVKLTQSFVYAYKKGENKIAVAKLSHKNLAKVAKDLVDPPPGEYEPEAEILNPATYKGPEDAIDLATGGPARVHKDPGKGGGGGLETATWTGKKSQKGAQKFLPKKENLVPVYNVTDKHVWLWVGTVAMPTLIKLTHNQVKKYVGKAVWPDGLDYMGMLDPKAYTGPEDIFPKDALEPKKIDTAPPIVSVPASTAPSATLPPATITVPPPGPDAAKTAELMAKKINFGSPGGMGSTTAPVPPAPSSFLTNVELKDLPPGQNKLKYPIPPTFVRNASGWKKYDYGGSAPIYGLPGTWYDIDNPTGVLAIYTPDGYVYEVDGHSAWTYSAKTAGIKPGSKWEDNISAEAKEKIPAGFVPLYWGLGIKYQEGMWLKLVPAKWETETGTILSLAGDKVLFHGKSEPETATTAPVPEPDTAPLASSEKTFDWPIPPSFTPTSSQIETEIVDGSPVHGLKGTWLSFPNSVPKPVIYDNEKGLILNIENGLEYWSALLAGVSQGSEWKKVKSYDGVVFPDNFDSNITDDEQYYMATLLGVWTDDTGKKLAAKYFKSTKTIVVGTTPVWAASAAGISDEPDETPVPDKYPETPQIKLPPTTYGTMQWPTPPNFVPTAGYVQKFKLGKGSKGHKKIFYGLLGVWHSPQGEVNAFQEYDTGEVRTMLNSLRWKPENGKVEKGDKEVKTPGTIWDKPVPENWKLSSYAEYYNSGTYGYLGMWFDAIGQGNAAYFQKTGAVKIIKTAEYVWPEGYEPPVISYSSPSYSYAPLPATVVVPAAPVKKIDKFYADAIMSLPSPDKLELAGTGSQMGLGGAGYKEVLKDSQNKQYLWKPAWAKGSKTSEPFRAMAQTLFSSVALSVRDDHIPISSGTRDGVVGTLQPMLDLASPSTLGSTSPAKLTDAQMLDVATEHLLDWVTSQHDSHPNNIVKTKDGRLLSIDKEQGFKYFPNDKLSTDYHPNGKYGEQEPYYNTFWRDWANGKFDFNPVKMASSVGKLANFDSASYVALLEAYAKSNQFMKTALQRENFIQAALTRRLNARADFEEFITELYKKRTGKSGEFTFDLGWITEEDKEDIKYKTVTFTSQELATDLGVKYQGSVPYFWKNEDGSFDETKKLIKAPKTGDSTAISAEKLLDMCKELGVTPIPWPNGELVQTGSAYHIVIVPTDQWDTAKSEKKVPVGESYSHTPGTPKYWPTTLLDKQAEVNTHVLNDVQSAKLGATGKRVSLDGLIVEGQVASVRRYVKNGETYYILAAKLRKEYWSKIVKNPALKKSDFRYYSGKYDADQDAFVLTDSSSDACDAHHLKVGDIDGYIVSDSAKYAYMGGLFLKSPSPLLKSSAEKWLKVAAPDHADAVMAVPSPEDLEHAKLRRILWALAPSVADSLATQVVSEAALREKIQSYGVDDEFIDHVESVEVYPGYQSHISPGLWKRLAGGNLKFLFNGISSHEALQSILKTGLMGIAERNLSAIPAHGGSYAADVQSGSGDGILLRPVTEKGFQYAFASHSFDGQFQAIVLPSVADRLDAYMHLSDNYGKCRHDSGIWTGRKSVAAAMEIQAKNYNLSAEISFRKGIALDKIVRIVTGSEETRKLAIASAIENGVPKVNGVPIEDFIVVCTTLGDAYQKYVKPLGV